MNVQMMIPMGSTTASPMMTPSAFEEDDGVTVVVVVVGKVMLYPLHVPLA